MILFTLLDSVTFHVLYKTTYDKQGRRVLRIPAGYKYHWGGKTVRSKTPAVAPYLSLFGLVGLTAERWSEMCLPEENRTKEYPSCVA